MQFYQQKEFVGILLPVVVDHVYPDITIRLILFNAEIVEGEPKMLEHNDLKWITAEETDNYQFCPADKEILERIKCSTAR